MPILHCTIFNPASAAKEKNETFPPTQFLMDHACTFSPSRRVVLYRYILIISYLIVYVKPNKYYNNNSNCTAKHGNMYAGCSIIFSRAAVQT